MNRMLGNLLLCLSVFSILSSPEVSSAQSGVHEVCGGQDEGMIEWMGSALRDSKVVAFGEIHGTNQAPRVFLRAVCAARHSGFSLVIGLELPETAIDVVRDAVNVRRRNKIALEDVARSPFWVKARDGRTSVAYVDLLVMLLKLERAGILTVVGFDLRVTGHEAFAELAGDTLLRRALAGANIYEWRIITISGRGHVNFDQDNGSLGTFFSSRGLPTLLVNTLAGNGSAWVCRYGDCGVKVVAQEGSCVAPEQEPGPIALLSLGRRSADICVGPVTPSPPINLPRDSASGFGLD